VSGGLYETVYAIFQCDVAYSELCHDCVFVDFSSRRIFLTWRIVCFHLKAKAWLVLVQKELSRTLLEFACMTVDVADWPSCRQ
jgi:hypothetical protein